MGLDVGVVKVEYLKRPEPPIYDFLFDLMLNPFCGRSDEADESDAWGDIWANNALYEFSRAGLRKRANNWANGQNLGPSEKAKLRRWIRNLPWQDGQIMLHMGN